MLRCEGDGQVLELVVIQGQDGEIQVVELVDVHGIEVLVGEHLRQFDLPLAPAAAKDNGVVVLDTAHRVPSLSGP